MCCTVYEIPQSQPGDMTASTSSSLILASQDNIPSILDILSAISDYKSLAIFRVIVELNNSGADSNTIRGKAVTYSQGVLLQTGSSYPKWFDNKDRSQQKIYSHVAW